MKISVIIPVLNERGCLPGNLARLKLQDWIHQIIIVDGGSTDGTLAWLREQSGVKLIESPLGRGIQLNVGARAATGDTLLFLHADSRLPANAGEELKGALDSPQVVGGCFCMRFDYPQPRSLAVVAAGINLRTALTRSATGDQAIFVRRSVFEKVGGFRDWPLFEDVDFVSLLKEVGKFAVIRSRVTVSARRHVHYGVFRTVMLVYLLRLGFWAGVSPFTLARWYQLPRKQFEQPRTGVEAAEHQVIAG
jgi:rSAM/selenodomain-associated transferase 2